MRPLPGIAAIILLAGCGASSTGGLGLAAPSGAPSQHPVAPPATTATAAPVRSSPSPVEVATVSAAAGTATAGPGHLTSPAPAPSPRPSPSAVAGTVTVTDEDSGTTVHLLIGQHLRVRLSSGTWDPPQSSAERVAVRRSTTGGYPTDRPVDATFDAVGRGTADVTAQSDAACFHTEPRCMMAQRSWRVTLVVG